MSVNQVLLVVDPSKCDEAALLSCAKSYRQDPSVELGLLCVMPELPAAFCQIPSATEKIMQRQGVARAMLDQLGDCLEIRQDRRWLKQGARRIEALRLARKLRAKVVMH